MPSGSKETDGVLPIQRVIDNLNARMGRVAAYGGDTSDDDFFAIFRSQDLVPTFLMSGADLFMRDREKQVWHCFQYARVELISSKLLEEYKKILEAWSALCYRKLMPEPCRLFRGSTSTGTVQHSVPKKSNRSPLSGPCKVLEDYFEATCFPKQTVTNASRQLPCVYPPLESIRKSYLVCMKYAFSNRADTLRQEKKLKDDATLAEIANAINVLNIPDMPEDLKNDQNLTPFFREVLKQGWNWVDKIEERSIHEIITENVNALIRLCKWVATASTKQQEKTAQLKADNHGAYERGMAVVIYEALVEKRREVTHGQPAKATPLKDLETPQATQLYFELASTKYKKECDEALHPNKQLALLHAYSPALCAMNFSAEDFDNFWKRSLTGEEYGIQFDQQTASKVFKNLTYYQRYLEKTLKRLTWETPEYMAFSYQLTRAYALQDVWLRKLGEKRINLENSRELDLGLDLKDWINKEKQKVAAESQVQQTNTVKVQFLVQGVCQAIAQQSPFRCSPIKQRRMHHLESVIPDAHAVAMAGEAQPKEVNALVGQLQKGMDENWLVNCGDTASKHMVKRTAQAASKITLPKGVSIKPTIRLQAPAKNKRQDSASMGAADQSCLTSTTEPEAISDNAFTTPPAPPTRSSPPCPPQNKPSEQTTQLLAEMDHLTQLREQARLVHTRHHQLLRIIAPILAYLHTEMMTSDLNRKAYVQAKFSHLHSLAYKASRQQSAASFFSENRLKDLLDTWHKDAFLHSRYDGLDALGCFGSRTSRLIREVKNNMQIEALGMGSDKEREANFFAIPALHPQP